MNRPPPVRPQGALSDEDLRNMGADRVRALSKNMSPDEKVRLRKQLIRVGRDIEMGNPSGRIKTSWDRCIEQIFSSHEPKDIV